MCYFSYVIRKNRVIRDNSWASEHWAKEDWIQKGHDVVPDQCLPSEIGSSSIPEDERFYHQVYQPFFAIQSDLSTSSIWHLNDLSNTHRSSFGLRVASWNLKFHPSLLRKISDPESLEVIVPEAVHNILANKTWKRNARLTPRTRNFGVKGIQRQLSRQQNMCT